MKNVDLYWTKSVDKVLKADIVNADKLKDYTVKSTLLLWIKCWNHWKHGYDYEILSKLNVVLSCNKKLSSNNISIDFLYWYFLQCNFHLSQLLLRCLANIIVL